MRRQTLSGMQNMRKTGQKTLTKADYASFMRNSLSTFALNREILYSHLLLKREILINLSQKIAKSQTNAGASNGSFQANICGV
jgi:hypothetical protein